jgi:hypothetical protein
LHGGLSHALQLDVTVGGAMSSKQIGLSNFFVTWFRGA